MNDLSSMDGTSLTALGAWAGLLGGSLLLRPYVFVFLALYLWLAGSEWGWRRALGFTAWAGGVAFLAEWTSTRVGVPFGLYHYTGVTVGRELYLSNVPFFDPLSFTFLAYASLGLARRLLRGRASPAGPAPSPLRIALASGVLMMWLDLVIDPLAVLGDRWFLGRIFYYPEPGWYFGVPVANFAGWVVVGTVIALGWELLWSRPGGDAAPRSGPGLAPADATVALYYVVLLFNLAVTAWIGEAALLGAGVVLHVPLAVVVVSSLGLVERARALRTRVGEPI